jgi:hypothetical protein
LIALKTFAVKYRWWSRVLGLSLVVCFGGSSAAAAPLSDYRAAVAVAVSDIEALIDRGGHESDADYQTRLTAVIDEVRTTLPRNQQVEFERGTWTIDNTWLHNALDELEQASSETRPGKLESVFEALRALEDRVAEFEIAQKVVEHKGASKQKLESILARPEYATAARGPNALTRFLRDIIRWIQKMMPAGPSSMEAGRAKLISRIIMIVVVSVAVLLILYVLWQLFKRFKRPLEAKARKKREARIVLGERLQPEQTASDLLAEAEALARTGDLRAAIRKGYIALLVELGDRNVISLAQYKTNRDYLRAVSGFPQLHSPLKRLTETFEQHWYGLAQATPNDWQDFRARYREALQTGN